jgi:hypothetical protein
MLAHPEISDTQNNAIAMKLFGLFRILMTASLLHCN